MTIEKNFLKKIWEIYQKLIEKLGLIASLSILVMMISILREIIGRYFFNAPSRWVSELNGYLLIFLVYLGASFTEIRKGNIRIDFIYQHLKGRTKKTVDMFIAVIGFLWSGMLIWQGLVLSMYSIKLNLHSSNAMGWPLFPSQLMIPIGSFLLGIVFIFRFLRCLVHKSPSNHK